MSPSVSMRASARVHLGVCNGYTSQPAATGGLGAELTGLGTCHTPGHLSAELTHLSLCTPGNRCGYMRLWAWTLRPVTRLHLCAVWGPRESACLSVGKYERVCVSLCIYFSTLITIHC